MHLLMALRMFAVLAIVLLLITQIFLPMTSGRKLFPMFRKSATAARVDKARDEVAEKREEVEQLTELTELERQRSSLERQLGEVTSKPAAETPMKTESRTE